MRVEHLSLTNFRNYARLATSLPARPLLLVGANAQGKTSLLEALYYLATSRSPYTASDRQLIHWGVDDSPLPFAKLTAEFSNRLGKYQVLDVTLSLDTSNGTPRFKKVIKLNHVEKRVMDVVGLLAVVMFLPQDLMLIEGAPQERRRFMDTTLCQVDASYLEALEAFEKVLPQRNALLRRIAEKRAKPAELGYWDEELAKHGAHLIVGRQGFLRELELQAQQAHQALTGAQELLTLQYQPSFTPTATESGQRAFNLLGLDLHRQLTVEDVAPQYLAQLQREAHASIERGATLSGPHRDELRLLINGRDCGLYGSRGQARTAILALKMAELAWMRAHIGESPLLLLDEVVAELDSRRRAYLMSQIGDDAQTLMTTTELDMFPADFLARADVWQVQAGIVSPFVR